MRITHIYHSGFAVELESCSLLVDWYEAALPQLPRDLPLFVLVSHEHHDHYDERIWDLPEQFEQVHFVVERDVAATMPARCAAQATVVDANESYDVAASHAELHIRTLESNDEGVAFLVEAEEHTLYFGADLNVWWWDREEELNLASNAFCRGQLAQIADKDVDVAFLALDPRLVDGLIGVLAYMEEVGAKIVVPTHYWANQDASRALLDDPRVTPELLGKIHFEDVIEL